MREWAKPAFSVRRPPGYLHVAGQKPHLSRDNQPENPAAIRMRKRLGRHRIERANLAALKAKGRRVRREATKGHIELVIPLGCYRSLDRRRAFRQECGQLSETGQFPRDLDFRLRTGLP